MNLIKDKRKSQIKFYTNLLKENEILLLKSKDFFYKNHYISSPLNVLTNFSGSEGEAIIDKNGKITIFVDTRYHILVEKQAYKDVEIYKTDLSESFFDAFKKKYKKDTVLYVSDDIEFSEYLKYSSYFDLRKYTLKKSYLKNSDLNKRAKIFLSDKLIDKQDFKYKFEKLKKSYLNVERLLVFNLDYISYLTNLRSFKCRFSSNFPSVLYLDFKNSKSILFVDKKDIKNISIDMLEICDLADFKDIISSIEDEIYVDLKDISLKDYLSIKKPKEIINKNASILPLLASIKPQSVINHLMEANKKVDKAILNFKNKLKEGLSELDLVNIFEGELKKQGAIMPSFKTILAINENTASIHYSSYDKNKILKNNSILLLDCGGYFEAGYATDITRTFYFGDNPNPYYKKIYTNVLKAFLMCYLSREKNAQKLDKMAREFLEPFNKEGFFFNHGLGHGIGTSCHQNPPRLSMISKDIIKPYQVHSIEPGLYGKNNDFTFGVRLENCVYSDINYNKISLSKFPFEEKLIDYTLLSQVEKDALLYWKM